MKQGTVLRIERISPNDGMGLRTVIFLKGCPLRCAWCSTPESHKKEPEWFYKKALCRGCGRCIAACPNQALQMDKKEMTIIRDRTKCSNCLQCTKVCYYHAVGTYGQTMTIDQIMDKIRKDSLFYFYSGGGVTLSGGDILLQADFSREILKECKEECINTTAEMDFYGSYENIKKLLPYLDSYYVDLKMMDEERHKKWTGVSNESIKKNLSLAAKDFPQIPLTIRVPLISGVNDAEENIRETALFCESLKNCRTLEFLPFHRLGLATYEYIGKEYYFKEQSPMTEWEAKEKIRCITEQSWNFNIRVSGQQL